jgi:hypothetical protein
MATEGTRARDQRSRLRWPQSFRASLDPNETDLRLSRQDALPRRISIRRTRTSCTTNSRLTTSRSPRPSTKALVAAQPGSRPPRNPFLGDCVHEEHRGGRPMRTAASVRTKRPTHSGSAGFPAIAWRAEWRPRDVQVRGALFPRLFFDGVDAPQRAKSTNGDGGPLKLHTSLEPPCVLAKPQTGRHAA